MEEEGKKILNKWYFHEKYRSALANYNLHYFVINSKINKKRAIKNLLGSILLLYEKRFAIGLINLILPQSIIKKVKKYLNRQINAQ